MLSGTVLVRTGYEQDKAKDPSNRVKIGENFIPDSG